MCGVAECNYLTVDEAMLRYHLKALHSEEPYFRCPHCPPPPSGQENQNIAIDKMGIHLKMHDARLYKCSHCNHHHYHRFVYICAIISIIHVIISSLYFLIKFYKNSNFIYTLIQFKNM